MNKGSFFFLGWKSRFGAWGLIVGVTEYSKIITLEVLLHLENAVALYSTFYTIMLA